MEILANKRDWIKWCHRDYKNSRRVTPPLEYPIAAEWDIDGQECDYPTYYTLLELKAIVAELEKLMAGSNERGR